MQPAGTDAARPTRLPWPAIVPAAAFLLLVLALVRNGLSLTEGRFVYSLDDPYIQMAIARNLALHGDWAVTPGHFEPASSSPLWTLLIAGIFRLAGIGEMVPLWANVVVALLVVVVLERMLRPFLARGPVRAAAVLAIVLAIPLPALVLTGLEAPLHVLLMLLLAWAVAGPTSPGRVAWRRRPLAIGALATLCVLTRFESLFLIAPLALVALIRRRPGIAGALAAGVALALGGYMTFALPQGGLWLPNPVLLKSRLVDLTSAGDWGRFLWRIPEELVWRRNSHMSVLLIAALWFLLPPRRGTEPRSHWSRALLAAWVAAALLHIQFASLGWFYRYEAYLVAIGLVTVIAVLARAGGRMPGPVDPGRLPVAGRIAAALALIVLATPLTTRTLRSLRFTPLAMRNIYEQQYQTARFVGAHFRGREVAVNDLGAVGYYGGARVEDLFGLATSAIARAKLEHRYDTRFIERYCASRGVEVAILYEPWFAGTQRLPGSWRRLARWTIRDNVSSDAGVVTIFATRPASVGPVRQALAAFVPTMPARINVELIE